MEKAILKNVAIAALCCILVAADITAADARQVMVMQPSPVLCDQHASAISQHASLEGELFGGTAIGSAGGLAIGSIFAASGVGAAIGAVVGVIAGIAVREQRLQQLYTTTYRDCMSGRTL